MIQIYYGFGKGKTTAAIGAGMRAKGADLTVSLVQFLKDNKSSELAVLPFDIWQAPDSLPFSPGEIYRDAAKSALDFVKNSKSDMIILDEFLDIIGEYISEDDALDLLKALEGREIIITGHKEVPSIFDTADYITYFEKIKHPYDKGVLARKGIEY
ncbi:MAG: cob(I)yrinic acid a,c-diamide adenosyltransferase [Eubacteriales bacterium]|nr:cob(I)yrinic acid a,c-diamide adenosyltransferase [Eubacteriales bacterium]